MKKSVVVLFLLLVSTVTSMASKLDTIMVYSAVMQKDVPCTVITPDAMLEEDRAEFPTLYLLHGHGNNYGSWTQWEVVQRLADEYSMIVVSPDAARNSWYWDSPVDSTVRYETFVSKELVEYIDSNYPTVKSREGRGITGLSMGGHGGLYLGIRHQDVYGAAGSTSGGVDIRPFPDSWEMKTRIGERDENLERWLEYSVMGQLDKLEGDNLALMIDCGTEDFFFEVNNILHAELLERGIPHRYMTSPGAHNWIYWKESIMYQMLFFSNYFAQTEARAN